jgi:hypothetical protein
VRVVAVKSCKEGGEGGEEEVGRGERRWGEVALVREPRREEKEDPIGLPRSALSLHALSSLAVFQAAQSDLERGTVANDRDDDDGEGEAEGEGEGEEEGPRSAKRARKASKSSATAKKGSKKSLARAESSPLLATRDSASGGEEDEGMDLQGDLRGDEEERPRGRRLQVGKGKGPRVKATGPAGEAQLQCWELGLEGRRLVAYGGAAGLIRIHCVNPVSLQMGVG